MITKKKDNLILIFFCLPALAVYLLFKLYPAISGMFYSLTNWNGLNRTYEFIGLANFVEILHDNYFWDSVLYTLKYVAVLVAAANIVALTLAVAIESRRKTKGLFRTIFYMPVPMMSKPAVCRLLWLWISDMRRPGLSLN